MRRAVFPGSFDPITLGHVDIIERGLPLFDEIILAIGTNSSKKYMFSLEKRLAFLEKTFKDETKIKVTTYKGLTVDFCKEIDAKFLLRGLRNGIDLEFEKSIGQTNFKMENMGIQTFIRVFSSNYNSIFTLQERQVRWQMVVDLSIDFEWNFLYHFPD